MEVVKGERRIRSGGGKGTINEGGEAGLEWSLTSDTGAGLYAVQLRVMDS